MLWMPHFWKMGSAETNLKQEMILPIKYLSTGYTEIVEYLPYFLLISLSLKLKWDDSISMVSMSYCHFFFAFDHVTGGICTSTSKRLYMACEFYFMKLIEIDSLIQKD